MRSSGAGLEWRSGEVRQNAPVHFHKHPGAHVLTSCGPGVLDVKVIGGGLQRMTPGEAILVWPEQEHELTVPGFEPCKYVCVGIEGKL